MADIDKSVGVVYQRRSRSGSDTDKFSPGVKDAMDRIFPKSPSNFLQNPFSDNHDIRLMGSKQLSRSSVSASSVMNNINSSLACSASNAHITTDTTTTATAIFTGLATSVSGTKSPILSSLPAFSNNMPSLPAPAVVKNSVSEQNGTADTPKSNPISKSRISKADLQICTQVVDDSPRSSVLEKNCSDSEYLSSQSEIQNVRKGKKHKKKRDKHKSKEAVIVDNEKNSTDEPTVINNESVSNATNWYDTYLNHPLLHLTTDQQFQSRVINSVPYIAETYPPSITVKQKLPKFKRNYVNVGSDKGASYIRKRILPSFVVLTKADGFSCGAKYQEESNKFDISLSRRVSHLTDLCAKNRIDCQIAKSSDQYKYRNIFEDCLIENPEDEFIHPRGRSLRKRNQKVSYVEPSEDDMLYEFKSASRKKSHNKDAIENEDKSSVSSVKIKEHSFEDHTDKSDKKKSKSKVDGNEEMSPSGINSLTQYPKTSTAHTGKKDDMGRSLVYVYPTGLQSKTNDSQEKSPRRKKRIGPASKTNQDLYTPAASLSTLSLPKSLLAGHITAPGAPTIAVSHPNVPIINPSSLTSSTTASPQFYMVKIDGKDYLVPVMAGSNPTRLTTPSSAVTFPSSIPQPAGPCRIVYQPPPGFPNAQSLLARGPCPNVTVTHFPPGVIPGAPLASGVRMLPTSLSTTNILSTVPLIGNPQVATSAIPVSGLSQLAFRGNRPPHLIPTNPSLVRSPIAAALNLTSSASSLLASLNPASGTQAVSTVAPFAAPLSTTVLRSTRPKEVTTAITSPTTSQIATSNTSATGSRCFRIIVPGCTASGMPARIATLGSQANSSPLSRMTISSSLLPQRKRSADTDITPEKRAAKRARLEKKYPLPPGVIIKTEPDEVPKPAPATIQSGSVRSLLGQNIQLITSAARGGAGGVQNIRLITPPSGSRQMRLGSNFIIRAPNASSVNLTSSSLSSISALATNASSLIVSPSAPTSTSSIAKVSSSASKTVNSTSVTTTTTTATTSSTGTTPTTTATTVNGAVSSLSTASDKITTLSYSVPSSNPITTSTTSSKDPAAASLDSLKENIEGLRKLIQRQEALGLKGPRLDKLKEVLELKEKTLDEMEREQLLKENSEAHQSDSQVIGVSAFDPVVID